MEPVSALGSRHPPTTQWEKRHGNQNGPVSPIHVYMADQLEDLKHNSSKISVPQWIHVSEVFCLFPSTSATGTDLSSTHPPDYWLSLMRTCTQFRRSL